MPTQKERRKKMTQSTIWLIAARSRYLKDLCHYYDLRQVGINYVPSFELSVLWFQCSFEKNKLNCRPFAMIARIIQCRSCVWLVRFICLIFVSTFPMKIKNIYILNVQTAKTVFLLVAEIRSENSSWLASFYFLVIHPIVLFFLSQVVQIEVRKPRFPACQWWKTFPGSPGKHTPFPIMDLMMLF